MKIDKKKGLMIAGGVIVVAVAAAAAGVHIHYSGRWYPGSKIGQVDVSGMTYEESVKEIQKKVDSYQLKIKARNHGNMTLTGKDIGLHLSGENMIKEAYNDQHNSSVLVSFGNKTNTKTGNLISYSTKNVKNLVKTSDLVTGKNGYQLIQPEDATIVYSVKKKYGVIKEEVEGNILNQDAFAKAIGTAVEKLSSTMDVTDAKNYSDVYKQPGLRKDQDSLKKMQETYNQYLLHWIEWDMGKNVKETMSPEDLQACIKVDTKNLKVSLDKKAVEKWLEKFCLKYKTQGIARTFKTHSGKKIKVSGGDYGWRIDYDKVIKQVMKALKTTPQASAIEAYEKNPSADKQKALTTFLKPVYSHKGYRMDFAKKQNDWDTQNYSEVDLSAQEVFIYKKGKLVFSCTCITGKATPDRITRTGVYDIKEKKLTKTLTGADYSVPTKYWTRIMWTGTGYHYSSRGDWNRWSPTYYKANGSHGCVNLTLSNAASVYRLTKIGDPVFIHY